MTLLRRPQSLTPAASDEDVEFYSRMLGIVNRPAARAAVMLRALNSVYWLAIIAAIGWLASMALDRDLPVRQISRSLVITRIEQGGTLQIHAKRVRVRQCELMRRFVIIDGIGRRHDFDPEPFDAYGPLGPDDDLTPVHVPLDAAPGHGKVFSILAWDCNPLQRALGWSITVVQPALEFEIVKREP